MLSVISITIFFILHLFKLPLKSIISLLFRVSIPNPDQLYDYQWQWCYIIKKYDVALSVIANQDRGQGSPGHAWPPNQQAWPPFEESGYCA